VTPTLRRALRAIILATALASTAVVQQLGAQGDSASAAAHRRTPRRVVMPLVMAVVATAAASIYLVPHADEAVGSCSSPTCVLPFTIGAGLFVGYLMGREMDQAYAVHYRQGAPVSATSDRLRLEGEPQWLAVGTARGAAGGAGGVQLFSMDAAPRMLGRRATGLRGLHGVDLAGNDLTIATATGVYEFAADAATGARRRDGDITAVVTWRGRRVIATGNRVELEPAPAARDTAWTSLTLGAPVRALGADPRGTIVWAATDSALVALTMSGDTLVQRSSVRLRGGARSVRSDGSRVVVAAGDRGLWLFDVDGVTARQRFVWAGARFAYDAIIARERVYVAAGGDGLYVLDAKAPRGVVLGLARQVGFAVALGVQGDYTYVLDRTEPAVHRLRSDFPLR
jgi:hypothetical protein